MRRRDLLMAGAALAGAALPAPAIANTNPEIKWRLTSSFPKSLDTLFGATEMIARRVAELTDDKFQIRVFAAGEIVPGLQVLDAVQNGTVECGHTPCYYYIGKDPAFAFETTIPFGLNARQQTAWMYEGGGLERLRAFFKTYNVMNFPGGNTGAQMGGWFRKEIKTLEDLKGLKFRISGLAGQILAKLGVVPTLIPASDIYPSLEKGAIDAAEWVGPHDDERLGFHKVAKYYYYPGWWDCGPQASLLVNLGHWEALPKSYRAALTAATAEAHAWVTAKYDAANPQALKRLIAGGAVLKPFSREILSACYDAAFGLYEELAAKHPNFADIYLPWKSFRADQLAWFRVAEHSYDSFVYAKSAENKGSKR